MYLVEQQFISNKRTFGTQARKIAERWIRNHTTRRRLGQLDDDNLRDVGIDPIIAAQEARKPFWKN